eukprot:SAG11_NODE_24980_length_365_cov_0.770677_1_plen_39_part_10
MGRLCGGEAVAPLTLKFPCSLFACACAARQSPEEVVPSP